MCVCVCVCVRARVRACTAAHAHGRVPANETPVLAYAPLRACLPVYIEVRECKSSMEPMGRLNTSVCLEGREMSLCKESKLSATK
jgi:hypothetical protein